ncbi:hypothetical protein [Saccharothrix obliqua]|uniref:hypothetical protein n=1 Tax=Saccharothrix obliqua TaxID=2861747 RepID=UPI001C5F1EA2|nr:hypothetical protein [Saccharothrix obliqua]MBW4716209.1 hypothetical protein [Saccharothrix obliqua]
MTAKWSAARILRDHWKTLVDARTGKTRALDIVAFYGTSTLVGVTAFLGEFQLRGLEGVLSGVSIYTALLFGLLVHVFQLRIRMLDQPPATPEPVRLIDELEANVSYTVFVGVLTTALLITTIALTPKDTPASVVLSAPASALLVHLILSLLLVLKRTRAAYRNLTHTISRR